MKNNFIYVVNPRVVISYIKGLTYSRVPETAVKEILKAKAGEIVNE
jgi:hypothetical protein